MTLRVTRHFYQPVLFSSLKKPRSNVLINRNSRSSLGKRTLNTKCATCKAVLSLITTINTFPISHWEDGNHTGKRINYLSGPILLRLILVNSSLKTRVFFCCCCCFCCVFQIISNYQINIKEIQI